MDENSGSKMGNEIFVKQIFLGGNFGEQVLEEQMLLGRTLWKQKILGGILARKVSFVLERKDMGGGSKIV